MPFYSVYNKGLQNVLESSKEMLLSNFQNSHLHTIIKKRINLTARATVDC